MSLFHDTITSPHIQPAKGHSHTDRPLYYAQPSRVPSCWTLNWASEWGRVDLSESGGLIWVGQKLLLGLTFGPMSLQDGTHFLMATFSRRLLAKLIQQSILEDMKDSHHGSALHECAATAIMQIPLISEGKRGSNPVKVASQSVLLHI